MNKIATLLAAATLAHTASAGLVFQADFNGTGSGTGGASDMVTLGGTGTLYDTAISDDISSSISDGKLVITDGSTTSTGRRVGAQFAPTTVNNGFNSMYTDTSGSLGYDTVNGAFDFFFQSSETELSQNSVRALDLRLGQDNDLRLVFTSNTGGSLAYQILDYSSGSGDLIGAGGYSFNEYTADTQYHIAVTMETGLDGLITTNIYVEEGNTAITTSSSPVDTFTTSSALDLDGSISNDSIVFGTSDIGVERVLEYDTFRIYDSIPTEFSAIPEPQSSVLSLGAVAFLVTMRRRRK